MTGEVGQQEAGKEWTAKRYTAVRRWVGACGTSHAPGSLWSRVYHGHLQREIGEKGNEHLGPVEGVRCVVTGRTSVPKPTWHENVLGIDTGVHIGGRGSRPPGRRVACTTAPPRNDARRQVSNALEGFK